MGQHHFFVSHTLFISQCPTCPHLQIYTQELAEAMMEMLVVVPLEIKQEVCCPLANRRPRQGSSLCA